MDRVEYNSGSNRASNLKFRERLLPQLYDTKSFHQLTVTIKIREDDGGKIFTA